jgi:hypothetical protein
LAAVYSIPDRESIYSKAPASWQILFPVKIFGYFWSRKKALPSHNAGTRIHGRVKMLETKGLDTVLLTPLQ